MSDSLMTNDFTRSLICGLCMKKSAYVCPRCGINYCSLNCYRDERHKNCSESFYQDCCIQSLRSTFASQSERSSMTEILKRESSAMSEIPHLTDVDTKGNNEQISDEDDESCSIAVRLQSVTVIVFKDLNLNDDNISAEVIWSRLTLKEKRDFNRFIESNHPLKKDCNDDSVEGEEQRKKTRIIKPQTNSSYNIIAYNCINDVLSTIQYKLMEANLPCHPSIMILLLEDISHILGNIAYCTRALQELHTLVLKFRKMLRESSDDDSTAESILSKVNTAHRKLVFLQACLDDKNQMARRWQTLVLPRLWSEISTELIQRIHDMKDFNDAGRRQDSKSAGPNWRNMIRNSNSCDNNNTDRVLIEPVNTDS
ncbi:unnamed protein product [Trichobilharzia regenti]|nr:unnamed protein product [Trichobilharzia regenti]